MCVSAQVIQKIAFIKWFFCAVYSRLCLVLGCNFLFAVRAKIQCNLVALIFSKQTILIRNDMFLLKEDSHIWRVFLNSNKKTDSVFLKQKITKSFKTVHNFHLIWLVPNCNRLYPMKFTKLVLSYFVDVFKCTGSINTLSVLTLKNVRHPSATHED